MKCVVGTAFVAVVCCLATWFVTSTYYEDKNADFSEDIISTEIALLEKSKQIGPPCEKFKNSQGPLIDSRADLIVIWKRSPDPGSLDKFVVDGAFQSAYKKVKNECGVQ